MSSSTVLTSPIRHKSNKILKSKDDQSKIENVEKENVKQMSKTDMLHELQKFLIMHNVQ